MKYTILDIAKASGVSRSTVSRVLNNDPRVSPNTRAKVLEIINAAAYKPSIAARGLVRGRMEVFALILGDVRNPFFSDIVYYTLNYMRRLGYLVILFNSDFDAHMELEYIKRVQSMGFSGILLVPTIHDASVIQEFQRESCPIVLLQRSIPDFQGDYIVQDNFQAGYMLTNHLIQLGHKRIAMLHGPSNSMSSLHRKQGFLSAMKKAKLHVENQYIFEGDFTMRAGVAIGKKFLDDMESFPSAIICGNDIMAIGFLEACKISKVSVPDSISVASFDDIEIASLESIQLTTMRQDVKGMCERACKILISRLSGERTIVCHVILPAALVIRKTTGPPAEASLK